MINEYFLILFVLLLLLAACKNKQAPSDAEQSTTEEAGTPVTVTCVETTNLNDYVELNATATYQQNNVIKASANGYLTSVHIKIGQMVHAGQPAFTLQTKEAHALGNTINKLDSSFHFSGIVQIKASAGGYIQSLDHQAGDFLHVGVRRGGDHVAAHDVGGMHGNTPLVARCL